MAFYMFSTYYNDRLKEHPELQTNITMSSIPVSLSTDSLKTELYALTITLTAFTLLLYILRIYARTFPATKLWWDDMYLSLAAVCLP
jgi:hypothetical protein